MGIEEMRVFDAKGKLKKRYSAKECKDLFWAAESFSNSPIQADLDRKRTVAKNTKEWVCKGCNKIFKSTVCRTYCHTPCVDPNESTTRGRTSSE